MLRAILGKKLNMSRIFDRHDRSVPITYVQTGPQTVLEVKSRETAGYQAVQVGFQKARKSSKPMFGRLKKLGVKENFRYFRELPLKGDLKPGEVIKIEEVFRVGDLVDIVGVSKGKGFAGVIKRHGFSGGPKTHGQSDRERAPGSIGSTTTPGRVFKGLKMAGHLGNQQVTIQGLEILSIDKESSLLGIKGALPGYIGNLLIIKKSIKKKKAYHEPEIPQMPLLAAEDEKPKGTGSDSAPGPIEAVAPTEEKVVSGEGEESHA